MLQEISQAEDTPDDFIHDLFNLKFWEGHPLALPIFGSVETVNAIDRELLVSFMADRYRAGRVFIAAAGMVDHERLVDDCERLFGGVSGDGTPEPISPAAGPHRGASTRRKTSNRPTFASAVRASARPHRCATPPTC